MSRFFKFILIATTLLYAACNSKETGSKDIDPETIYFDYQVWGDEGTDVVTVMLQYRLAGKNGPTLLLEEPGKVELDGELINADSSKITGAFYEIQKPVKEFAGKHTIVFTDINLKQYNEEFIFQSFAFADPLPDSLPRGDIIFELEGVGNKNYIRVVLTDTSRQHDGINRVDTVTNGRITITEKDLRDISSGPVHLELIKEEERKVKNGTPEGGRMAVSYGLKREFKLVNSPQP
ncbi:MAG TPA: hypothetical protein VF487_19925 [Chitinophagaceae bacterium]